MAKRRLLPAEYTAMTAEERQAAVAARAAALTHAERQETSTGSAAGADTNSMTTTTDSTIEIAYRVPGAGGFKRRSFATQAAAERFVDRLLAAEGDDVEIRWAD